MPKKSSSLTFLLFVLLAALTATGIYYFRQSLPPEEIPGLTMPVATPVDSPLTIPTPESIPPAPLADLKKEMLSQLNRKKPSQRELPLPKPPAVKPERPLPPVPKLDDMRAQGREKRKDLPLGVVLVDDVKVFEGPQGDKTLYTTRTGDFVKVYPGALSDGRLHVHPGVDLYLAATSREYETAGNRLPDRDGWIERGQIHVFEPEQAREFTEGIGPMTLGNDPNFSTVSFYERALKNPDPVVHRVIGPRMIELLAIHEGYIPAWGRLYRDPDLKIRSLTLSTLKDRGVGSSAQLVDDLITRVVELTSTKAVGEREAEVITVLEILRDSRHPRVAAALGPFLETWPAVQTDRVVDALKQAVSNP